MSFGRRLQFVIRIRSDHAASLDIWGELHNTPMAVHFNLVWLIGFFLDWSCGHSRHQAFIALVLYSFLSFAKIQKKALRTLSSFPRSIGVLWSSPRIFVVPPKGQEPTPHTIDTIHDINITPEAARPQLWLILFTRHCRGHFISSIAEADLKLGSVDKSVDQFGISSQELCESNVPDTLVWASEPWWSHILIFTFTSSICNCPMRAVWKWTKFAAIGQNKRHSWPRTTLWFWDWNFYRNSFVRIHSNTTSATAAVCCMS